MSRCRHEYKYRIYAPEEAVLISRAEGLLARDHHVYKNGAYLIRSAYFDDIFDSCLMDNIAGTDPRSKFRIRYYGQDTGRISLEKKSKVRGMTQKEACRITEEECRIFLSGKVPEITDEMPDIKKRLFTEIAMRGLFPKVIVTYERIPFIYPGGNVRVTFDRNISSSDDLTRFLSGDYAKRPVLPAGESVMEVKWDEVLPVHIKEALSLDSLQWTAFSKYFVCRKMHL